MVVSTIALLNPTISNIISYFETQLTFLDYIRPNRLHPLRSEEILAAVTDNVPVDRGKSIRREWRI